LLYVRQQAQLSQRDRAMHRVIEYFDNSTSVEMTQLSLACVSPY